MHISASLNAYWFEADCKANYKATPKHKTINKITKQKKNTEDRNKY